MNRLLLSAPVLFLAPLPLFAESKELQLLQEAVHKAIAETEPSVVCILVSRSERYREFGAAPSTAPGKLGGFEARPEGESARRELIRRLDLAGADPVPESYGSGVVIDADGLILTHFHIVQNATKIYVRLPGKKGSYADIHAADGRSDLAVLKLLTPPADLKPIRFGDGGAVKKGDFVVGVAHPFSAKFRGGSPASHGIVSNLRMRPASASVESEQSRTLPQLGILMQTDLRLNLGCSGGAVANLNGELIALTTSTAAVGGDTPGGFAVPMDARIRRIVEVLKKGEEVEYGFLGVSFNTVDIPERRGVIIDRVADGTPAKRAGLQDHETITAVDRVPVKDYDDLFLSIGTALAGSEVTIDLHMFGARSRHVAVKLSKFKNPFPVIASKSRPPVFGIHVDYGSIANTDAPVPDGVYIREVDRGSVTEKKHKELLERGRWIVTHVNRQAVSTPDDFHREVAKAKGPLELRIVEVVRNPEATAQTLILP